VQRWFESDGIHRRTNQGNADSEWLFRKWAEFQSAHPRGRRRRGHHHQHDRQAGGRNLLGPGESRGLGRAGSVWQCAGDLSESIRGHQAAYQSASSGLERKAREQASGKIGVVLRREKTSVSQEDYLKAIWEMLEENQIPISARLAEELRVTPPAVTAALKRMTRDGHVSVDRKGQIVLTHKGRKLAEHLALRHQLAEMLLTDVIGLSWAKAHDEAERSEHAISPEVEALLIKRFGDKKSCPHGVPMRGGIATLRKQGAVLLGALRPRDS